MEIVGIVSIPCVSELDFGGSVVIAKCKGDWAVCIECAAVKTNVFAEGLEEEVALIY